MDERLLLGKRLFFLTAHPDDETFAAAGTLYRNAREGGVNALLCATHGEKGGSHLQHTLSEDALAKRRANELQNASQFLGVAPADLHLFAFPDTKVIEHVTELVAISVELVRQFKSDVIVGFDKSGITGHADHIAMSLVAARVAKDMHLPLATFTLPSTVLTEHRTSFLDRQKAGKYISADMYEEPNLVVPIDRDIKLQAFAFHTSQYEVGNPLDAMPQPLVDAILENEYFKLMA